MDASESIRCALSLGRCKYTVIHIELHVHVEGLRVLSSGLNLAMTGLLLECAAVLVLSITSLHSSHSVLCRHSFVNYSHAWGMRNVGAMMRCDLAVYACRSLVHVA